MILDYNGKSPKISSTAYIAPNATIIGDVVIEDNASIWFNAVLRGDVCKITIGKNSNVQDGAVLHGDFDAPVEIGENVTIGHNATVHGCKVEKGALIGMGSTLLNKSVVKRNAVVGAGAVVPPGKTIPIEMLAVGNPLKIIKKVDVNFRKHIDENKDLYVKLGKEYEFNNN